MKRFRNFLKTEVKVTRGDLLTSMVSVAILAGLGYYLNDKLYESKIDGINKDCKISELDLELKLAKKEINELENKCEENNIDL